MGDGEQVDQDVTIPRGNVDVMRLERRFASGGKSDFDIPSRQVLESKLFVGDGTRN